MNFEEISYHKHEHSWAEIKDETNTLSSYKNWFDHLTVDLWRHTEMLSVINPLLKKYPNTNWITIGDGCFGTSATYIEKNGGRALATDIDDTLLKRAHENKMISSFAKCNAEFLKFENNSFDFSYCKQAYHHFPRPYIAIYEMLRVSKNAVVLTEPADWIPLPIPGKIIQLLKIRLKKILHKKILHPDTGSYEPDGNYIFTVSEREIEKIALGLNLPAVAFKRFTDTYINGIEKELYSNNGILLKRIKRLQLISKIKRILGLERHNQIQTIIFKTMPDENLIHELKKEGFKFITLPKNPFI